MWRLVVIASCVVSCREPRPAANAQPEPPPPVEPRPAPPVPVPVPVPVPEQVAVPEPIASVVETPGMPRVTFFDLTTDGAPRYRGWPVEATRVMPPRIAEDVFRLLGNLSGYYKANGEPCLRDPVGYRLEKGDAHADVVIDCGRVFVTERGHDTGVELRSDLILAMTDIREKAGLALEPYPTTAPVISTRRGGGFGGEGRGGVSVWSDGTVQFRGPQCVAGRRSSVDPSAVTKLVDTLEAQGLLGRDKKEIEQTCRFVSDGFHWTIDVHAPSREQSVLGFEDVDCAWLARARAAIDAAVGRNPCLGGD